MEIDYGFNIFNFNPTVDKLHSLSSILRQFTADFKCIDDMAEMNHFTTSDSKKHLNIDWKFLLDDPVDDRPPDILITPGEKSKGRGGDLQQPKMDDKDTEYQMKTDGELEIMISRTKTTISSMSHKLPDKGEKLKATLRRCVAEVERRKRNRAFKGSTRCKETLQLSDESDDGVNTSSVKKKSDQKSSASPNFVKLFSEKLDADENRSRTVNSFGDETSFFKSFQVRNTKQNGKGLSSRLKELRSPVTFMGDNKKQRIANADKKDSHSGTSSPWVSIRKKPLFSPKANVCHNQTSRKLKPKNGSAYCLVDEDPLEETFDDWSDAFHNPPSRKSNPRDISSYFVVDEEPIAEKLDDCMKDVTVYYPSRDEQDSVEVVYKDMECLAPQAYLSSTVMNFYIRYLQQQMTSSQGNFHFFNTYFYNKLQKLSYKEDSFVKFRKWWKGVDLFNKAYILLPVHDKAHWSLGIICIPSKEDELGPIVLHLDSLKMHDTTSISDNITRFVKEEWSYLRDSQHLPNPITDKIWDNLDTRMDDFIISVPQQRNDYDCGLFVLYYMERFIKEAPQRFKEDNLSMFSKKWFRPEEASKLRRRIHNLLVHEFKSAKQNSS